jgi:hypothetical protein
MKAAEFSVDEILALEIHSPGSDHRYGINIVWYPPSVLVAHIVNIQNHLKSIEPDQYYYPSSDLHLTVLELASGLDRPAFEKTLKPALDAMSYPSLYHSAPRLRSARARYDERACAVIFSDISGLAELRDALTEGLITKGITLQPRYKSTSAHLTFMRYIQPLHTGLEEWTGALDAIPSSENQEWDINEIWLTAGATWYGMHSRIQQHGPYRVA